MTDHRLESVWQTALALPEKERAKPARDFVASLDGAIGAGAVDKWDLELRRRLAEVQAGTAVLLSRQQFRDRMEARLG